MLFHVVLDCGCSMDITNDNDEFNNNVWVGQKGFCGNHGIVEVKDIDQVQDQNKRLYQNQ